MTMMFASARRGTEREGGGAAVRRPSPGLSQRPKLRAGARREWEGERIPSAPASVPRVVQRKCDTCATEDEARQGMLQRKEAPASAGERSLAPGLVGDTLRANGRPLESDVRAYFEARFERDFSEVRTHTGAQADASARALNARAYTVGRDVVFRSGAYAPRTDEGKKLVAHELTHVVQQSGVHAPSPQTLSVSEPSDAGEREADRVADAVVRDGHAPGIHSTGPSLQRACGTEFGEPAPPCALDSSSFAGTRFHFQLNCDDFLPGEAARLTGFVRGLSAGGAIRIHGSASNDGPPGFNQLLSCHRANRAAELIRSVSPSPTIGAIIAHGPIGAGGANRAVIIEAPSAPQPQPEPQPQPGPQPEPAPAARPVFICAKPLARAPAGNHAFFRFGGAGAGNPTMELEPEQIRPGCFQGVQQRNFSEDFTSTTTNCLAIAVSEASLDAEFASYPRGHYCTFGPNSNTFIGVLARNTGVGVRPSGWLPGFDDRPPPIGTFAPSPESTLFGCTLSDCPSESELVERRRAAQLECVKDLGGCGLPGGIPTDADRQRWNEECRGRTGYEGPDQYPTPEDCAGHGASSE